MAWLKKRFWLHLMIGGLLISCSGSKTAQPSLQEKGQAASKPQVSKQQASKPTSPKIQSNVAQSSQEFQATHPSSQSTLAKPKSAPVEPKSVAASPKTKLSPAPKLELSTAEQKWVSKVEEEVQTKTSIAKQDAGQTYLGHVLRSQQATKLVSGAFTDNLQELIADAPTNNEHYQLQILEANNQKAVVVAAAKQNGNFSYTGAVYAQATTLPVATICKSNEPTKTPPGAPKLKGSDLVCAQGSTAIQ